MQSRLWLSAALAPASVTGAAAFSAAEVSQAADRPAPAPVTGGTAPPLSPPDNVVAARIDGAELHFSDLQAAQQSLPPEARPLDEILSDPGGPARRWRVHHRGRASGTRRPGPQPAAPAEALRESADPGRALKGTETRDRPKARYPTVVKEKANRRCMPGAFRSKPRPQ